MAVGDVWKLTLRQALNTAYVQNSFYFATKTTGQRTQAECQTLADAVKNLFRVYQIDELAYTTWDMRELFSVFVSYDTSACKRSGGSQFDGALTGTLIGGDAGDPAANQLALVSTYLTGKVGRSRRGRWYFAGHNRLNEVAGRWGSGMITSWTTQMATFLTTWGIAGTDSLWQAYQWSDTIAFGCKPGTQHPHLPTRYASPSPQTAGSAITQIKVRDIPYTQRRRVINVGI